VWHQIPLLLMQELLLLLLLQLVLHQPLEVVFVHQMEVLRINFLMLVLMLLQWRGMMLQVLLRMEVPRRGKQLWM
jgi:hypothetical protein